MTGFWRQGEHVHGYIELMAAAAGQDAAQGADIGVIATPGECDVVFAGEGIIGRVEIDPSSVPAPDLEPGVRGVGAN